MNPDKLRDTLASASSALCRDASQTPSLPGGQQEGKKFLHLNRLLAATSPANTHFLVLEPKFQPTQLKGPAIQHNL